MPKPFTTHPDGLAEQLLYAALIESGFVYLKDGGVVAGYQVEGPDIASCTASQRNYLAEQVNRAIASLSGNISIWFETIRRPSSGYPSEDASSFPDPITRLIDKEREQAFLQEGSHFESGHILLMKIMPPVIKNTKFWNVFYRNPSQNNSSSLERTIENFKKILIGFEDAIGSSLTLRRLGSYSFVDSYGKKHLRDDLINYLNFAITGEYHAVNLFSCAMYLDGILGGQDFWAGETPKIGNKFIVCVAIDGVPSESYPNILEVLNHLPMTYRATTRMLLLEQHEALKIAERQHALWKQSSRGSMFQQILAPQNAVIDQDAVRMMLNAESVMADIKSGQLAFGLCTQVVVVMDENRETALENARLAVREIKRLGFNCRIETINAMEAWLGSLPGHNLPNIRRPLTHSKHLAHMLPLSTIWPGKNVCPNPLFPPDLPPLMHAATIGLTPFRLNLHVGDVGHTLVFGPTGAGKSTLLAMLIAQFRRYPNATIFAFDKGNSLWPLVNACGGQHYDIGSDASPSFSPLSVLDGPSDAAWAADWLATCYQLQTNQSPNPQQMHEIHRVVELQKTANSPDHRSLSEFISTMQDKDLRAALRYYTGPLGYLLDARKDNLKTASFTVLELEELMGLGDKAVIPVLLYLFRRFEKSLKGQPALLVLDEAWVMLGHPVFREKIREWLKVLRKANCAVVLATQSLSDAIRSGIYDVLIESCPTKILLPNEEADKTGTPEHPGPYELYRMMGLNETEIHIIKTSIKKKHYYYTSPEGRRLFELGLGPLTLSFVGVSDKENLTHMRGLKAKYAEKWPFIWLKERNISYESSYAPSIS